MKRAGLVLEGGATRGIFTSGALDYLMEQNIYFSDVIGVSAGACNAVDYVSRQPGRTRDCMIPNTKDMKYINGVKDTIREKSLMNMDLMTVMLQAAAPAGGGSASFLIMMVLIFAVMYFFMIRPQQKRQKELVKFRNALEKGQKIITAGGIYGTIKEVKENYVLVEVDSNVAIRVDKNMVMKDPSDLAAQAK